MSGMAVIPSSLQHPEFHDYSKNIPAMKIWTDQDAPRIWRSPDSHFIKDEPRQASDVYTSDVLAGIQDHGFNGIWLRGRLYDLMQSTVLPQLNDEHASERIKSIAAVIERGKKAGVGVYLFFNEPLALDHEHTLWQEHPEIQGALYSGNSTARPRRALCTQAPLTKTFMDQAIQSVLEALPGLAGVILITATEHFSHCWSHTFRFHMDDGIDHKSAVIPDCPRCRDIEPSKIVLDLLNHWQDAVNRCAPDCRVIAWNWSWSMWYPDPQTPIVSKLPERCILQVDWERGGTLDRGHETVAIDEYSMSYPGPSERFLTSKAAAPSGTLIHAKLQLGTTHEIATIPNLPLLGSLHAKLAGMSQQQVAGFMGCWNFGCSLTLNTFAIKQFLQSPQRYAQADVFLADLAKAYLGINHCASIIQAWQTFDEAFRAYYPFSMVFLYRSPVNDAPAHPLSLQYRAQELGHSHLPHEMGDDALFCLGPMPIANVVKQLDLLVAKWREGLELLDQALAADASEDVLHQTRRRQEQSTAHMVAFQMQSTANFFRFHQRRLKLTNNATTPCTLPADAQLQTIMEKEIENTLAALPLVEGDTRLGLHQESHAQMYDAPMMRAKIKAMKEELALARGV